MTSKLRSTPHPPSLVRGRKGQASVVDCLVALLWKVEDGGWPAQSFEELRNGVSNMQGYEVGPSTIRSSIYKYPKFFQRAKGSGGRVLWTLTAKARASGNES